MSSISIATISAHRSLPDKAMKYRAISMEPVRPHRIEQLRDLGLTKDDAGITACAKRTLEWHDLFTGTMPRQTKKRRNDRTAVTGTGGRSRSLRSGFLPHEIRYALNGQSGPIGTVEATSIINRCRE